MQENVLSFLIKISYESLAHFKRKKPKKSDMII